MKILSAPQSGYPGLSLRQLECSDLPSWYAYLSNPDVVRHTSWNLQSENDLLPMFDALDSELPSSIRRLAIINDLTGELIGTIGFHTVSDVNRTAEIAYDLAPAYRGKGVASAVCSAVTQWSFSAFGSSAFKERSLRRTWAQHACCRNADIDTRGCFARFAWSVAYQEISSCMRA